MIRHGEVTLSRLGDTTIRLEAGGTVVYIDPPEDNVEESHCGDGDIICISHGHRYDSTGIRAVADETATVVYFQGINTHHIGRDVERPTALPFEIRTVDAEADIAVSDAIVRTTAAYNDPDGPHVSPSGEPYHPKGRGCGFHVTLADVSVYYPGDTDVLDGHEHLDVDVFCPPIGGVCTMDRHEAAALTEAMNPDLAVPILNEATEVDEENVEAFRADLEASGTDVA